MGKCIIEYTNLIYTIPKNNLPKNNHLIPFLSPIALDGHPVATEEHPISV